MRKTLLTGVVAAMAFAVPASADTPNPNSPAQQCRAERTAMGDANFRTTYGTNANRSNAFGKCVAKHARAEDANTANAARQCRAERNDANFAATHGGKTFAQFYGTNANGRNAFGKCVSAKSAQATDQQQTARINAARKCRTEQRADAAAFRTTYGTNANRSNAFGRCVSKHARA
ncbi:MAG TPA: hypothetical protein VNB64_13905 [Solirubrobacteraceae bacterium]|nr:hypothetical protein [Solirubrobacteraceae bacterium]